MKKLLFLFILLFTTTAAFAKGGAGMYFITGKALDADNNPLRNETITMEFNGETTEVQTDSAGVYKLEVRWVSACPSGLTPQQRDRENERLNPKWIRLTCKGKTVKVENEWKKYASLYPGDDEKRTRHLDLIFD